MGGRVVVVGSVNVDLVVAADRLPGAGETVSGGKFGRHQGGKGGNQAVAAARLGVDVFLIGAVGDDTFGAEAHAALEAEGVDTTGLRTVPGAETGVALIVVDRGGENLIALAPGANAAVTPAHIREAFARLRPKADDVVLVGHEVPTDAAREALRLAGAAGAMTIFNPAPAEGLDRSTLGLAAVVTPNRRELATLVSADVTRAGGYRPAADPVLAARSLLTASAEGPGPGAILVSLGPAGAVLVRGAGESVEIPAARVAAVDTVGAGDALNGALAVGLAMGLPLEDAARRAVVAASLSTTRAGAREGMPTTAELEAGLTPSPGSAPR